MIVGGAPGTVALSLGLAAVACYVPALRAWKGRRERRGIADVLLLVGALLISADLGYLEYTFRLLGGGWKHELLLLAAFHGIVAYRLGSRLMLSIALIAFAVWVNSEALFSPFFPLARATMSDVGLRCLWAALACMLMRALQGWLDPQHRAFDDVYEGFAVHLAGAGALTRLMPGYLDRPLPSGHLLYGLAGLLTVVAIVGVVGWWRRRDGFILAALAYTILGIWRVEFWFLEGVLPLATASLVTVLTGVTLLWLVHRRLKRASMSRS